MFGERAYVMAHATSAKYKASHPNFKYSDIYKIDNVATYYSHLMDLDFKNLHHYAQRFLGNVHSENLKRDVPKSFLSSKPWRDLQAAINDKKKQKKKALSRRLHFCDVCGMIGASAHDINHHAIGVTHRASHQDYKAILLEKVEIYYTHIRNLDDKDLHNQVGHKQQTFIKDFQNYICRQNDFHNLDSQSF